MRGKVLLVTALAISVVWLSLAVTKTGYAKPPAAAANQATVDITINDTGGVSVGGIALNRLGVLPLDPQVTTIAQRLNSAHVIVQDQNVTLDVQQTPVLKIDWTPSSRTAAANLATRYGVQLSPDFITRLEEWISTSNLDVTVRYANELSKPAQIGLSKPVLVDIADNGQLTVEKIPLAAQIAPAAVQTIMMGGKQAIACWNKGTLSAKVDGAELPKVTITAAGIDVANQALNLNIPDLQQPLLGSRFGVDLSMPGGAHATAETCPE